MADKPAFLSNGSTLSKSSGGSKPVNPGESLGGPKPSIEDHLGSMRNAQQPKGDDFNKDDVPEGGEMPFKAAGPGKASAAARPLPFRVAREEGHTPTGDIMPDDTDED